MQELNASFGYFKIIYLRILLFYLPTNYYSSKEMSTQLISYPRVSLSRRNKYDLGEVPLYVFHRLQEN